MKNNREIAVTLDIIFTDTTLLQHLIEKEYMVISMIAY